MTVSGAAARGQDRYVVAGRVIDALTGAGVGRAQVALEGWSEGQRKRRETFSDAGGGFRFEGLASGQFAVVASKPRFEAKQEAVAVGPSKESMDLRLTPYGVIAGRVTDGDGRPMQGVQVRAYTSSVQDGRTRLSQSRSVSTNDQGDYRLWNLREGKYYLKAVGRAGGTALFTTDRLPTYSSRESFAPVYHGGANRVENATPLTLAAGQEARADFRLLLEPAFRIRGVVTKLAPYESAKFELLSGTEDVSANRAVLSAVNGAFEVQDVVPGAYRLRVTQGEREKRVVAEMMVTVAGGDVGPLALQAYGTVNMTVREEVTGDTATGAAPGQMPMSRCTPVLDGAESAGMGYTGYPMERGGPLVVQGLLPGEYTVRVVCHGAYLTGLTAGGVDLMATGKLTLVAGAPAPELVVRSDRNTGRAAIEIAPETVQAMGFVVAVPASVTPEGSRMVSVMMGKGQVELGPGEYTFFLVKEFNFPYREGEALGRLKNGVSERVETGQTVMVKLKEMAE